MRHGSCRTVSAPMALMGGVHALREQAGGVDAPGELEDGVHVTEDLGEGVTLLAVCD